MNKDIVSELLERIETAFKDKTEKSEILKKKILALKSGKATHLDSNEFAIEVGNILADVFKNEITEDTLPDKKMYYNIAKRLIEPNMKTNYDIVSDYSREVQEVLNEESSISLKAIKPEINQDRIDGIVNKISDYDDFKEGKWLLDEPIKNFTQSVVDDTIKTNADFQFKSGLTPKIVRKEAGGCCDWCKEVAGVYEYPDVPKDVFRRHQRCKCTVDYLPGNGKKRDVWTKRWADSDRDEEIQKRIKFSKELQNQTKPQKSSNAIYNKMFNDLNTIGVEYKHVDKLKAKLPDDEIINRLSGGDMTAGSCASLGLAYIGQKQGWDVLDFRGGESGAFFSRLSNLRALSKIDGVQTLTANGKSSITVANRLLGQTEIGKEYYLVAGRHASIVRKTEEGTLQYLELQSAYDSGWTNFNGNPRYTLRERFGCSSSSSYGILSDSNFMIDIDGSDFSADDFKSLLGYINTSESNQKRGKSGYAK